MKISCVCVLLIGMMLLCGCAITHDYKPAAGIKDARTIRIVNNRNTKAGFLDAMTSWLKDNGYQYNVLPADSNKDQKGWILTYTGRWSWDTTIYLAKALIEAYKDGARLGYASYSVAGNNLSVNPNKFRKAEKTVKEMMINLFK